MRPLADWLEYNGFSIVTKSVTSDVDQDGRRRTRGNMAVELTVDALELSDQADHIVIFAGDGEFGSLVAALQRRGKRVSVVSTLTTSPPTIADNLRRQADQFIELKSLEPMISRDPIGRQEQERRTAGEMPSHAPPATPTKPMPVSSTATSTVAVETRSRSRVPQK